LKSKRAHPYVYVAQESGKFKIYFNGSSVKTQNTQKVSNNAMTLHNKSTVSANGKYLLDM